MDFLKPYGVVLTQRQMEHYKIEKKALPQTVRNSYKIKFWSAKGINPDTVNIGVYEL